MHLCYGDYKHRHFAVPTDLGLAVRVVNAVADRAPLDFVHLPVDRETGRSAAYFTPLDDLRIAEAELALGVIDYERPVRFEEVDAAGIVFFGQASRCRRCRARVAAT